MQLELLDAKHPYYVKAAPIWAQCSALYAGGASFEELLDQFLPQNPSEPYDVYQTRKRESAYLSYVGPIVDYFVSWLFSASFDVRPRNAKTKEIISTDPVYSEFIADVSADVSLHDFMRHQTALALIKGCSHWLIEMPLLDEEQTQRIASKQMVQVEYDEAGLGAARLVGVEREQLYDWEVDENGKLAWCVIHWQDAIRPDPRRGARDMIRETWKIYDRQTVEIFEVTYEAGKRPGSKDEIPSKGRFRHQFLELPLVSLDVKDGLWIGERTRKPQIEHFRLSVAKSWLIRRTCYAMPVINLDDAGSEPSIMGAGYYIKLGKDEKFSWSAPPNTPFDVIQASIDAQRDEIFRIVHQMAQGLDNNADTVGRSADSKQLDTAATRIMLNAYGDYVRKAIEETLEILSDARGDTDVYWAVEGFNGYDTATAAEVIANATDAMLLNIPSKIFRREIKTKVANALLSDLEPTEKDKMKAEIREAIDAMAEVEELMLPSDLQTRIDIQKMKDQTKLKSDAAKQSESTSKPNPPRSPNA